MTIWQLHMLNARSALTPVMAEIRAHARATVAMVSEHIDLPRFDLVVRTGDQVIPDWGIGGYAPAPGIIEITLDPDRVAPEHFRRILVHEMHHLARWDGPGYGRALGEALVSEGLAGHFVQQVLGGPPDPWDATRPGAGSLKQATSLWARRDYDHGEWFMGRGRMRKWTGYGLGHRLIATHLAEAEGQDAATLVHAPADGFRAALRRLMAIEGVEAPEDEDGDAPTAVVAPEAAVPDDAVPDAVLRVPDEAAAPVPSRDAEAEPAPAPDGSRDI